MILSELDLLSKISTEEYVEKYFEYVKCHLSEICPTKGAINLLKSMKEKNIPIAIATSSFREAYDKKMKDY